MQTILFMGVFDFLEGSFVSLKAHFSTASWRPFQGLKSPADANFARGIVGLEEFNVAALGLAVQIDQ